ncbi:MAG: UXV-star family (seleno)protein [Desulfobacterota bacterium]|nr:UXV-star family (seleno)protein [Thermodesulfobacteriota bacterium]
MSSKVLIYGTEGCPYTRKAREAYGDKAVFRDVGVKATLEEMLKYSKGKRKIPVIVEGGKVTIGFGGS